MPGGNEYPGPDDALELYRAAVDSLPEVDLKGAKNPYTSRNGHMFSFLSADGTMAVRLPPKLRNEFLAEYETEPVVSYGAVMKEYVAIPRSLLEDTAALLEWLAKSHDWIGTLEPKPTKKG